MLALEIHRLSIDHTPYKGRAVPDLLLQAWAAFMLGGHHIMMMPHWWLGKTTGSLPLPHPRSFSTANHLACLKHLIARPQPICHEDCELVSAGCTMAHVLRGSTDPLFCSCMPMSFKFQLQSRHPELQASSALLLDILKVRTIKAARTVREPVHDEVVRRSCLRSWRLWHAWYCVKCI